MNVLVAAVLAAYFSVVPTPPQITSSFDLHGVSVSGGTAVVNEMPPTLEDGPTVFFSFVAPVSGACQVFQVFYVDGKPKAIVIAGHEGVKKGSVQMGAAPLTTPNNIDGSPHGYEFLIGCADPEHSKETVRYSKVYHIDIPRSAV